jgi:2-polyprenyl-6-methoxyphenol hydroxylase-like FAD-dependent oxidoreductase
MRDTPVLIAGAGPTGLVLALFLSKMGVRARIVDKSSGPGETSRALAMHARTLEFYRQIGIADDAISEGIKMEALHLWDEGKPVANVDVGDLGEGLSPYPFVLSYPQDYHEKMLVARLRDVGIEVERECALVDYTDDGDSVRATLRRGDEEERATAEYLCGCDGASSRVREVMGVGFPGGTYEALFFVADVAATGPAANGDLNAWLATGTFLLVFPVRQSGTFRLVGIVPREAAAKKKIEFDDIRPLIASLGAIDVHDVNWFSTYRTHHRVAAHFRAGRVFLAGDSGHIHSPAGGQGMITGVGDAVNLAWKLAAVVGGHASETLLDTYEPERIAFARTLVATTDRAFTAVSNRNLTGEIVRTLLIPHIAPFLLGFSKARKATFRLISQTRINYRESALAEGEAGDVYGGERLPWVERAQNFDPLRSLDWQLHVFGEPGARVRDVATARGFAVHVFEWTDEAADAGFERDACYLVRPDGYVGLAAAPGDAAALERYVARWAIQAR